MVALPRPPAVSSAIAATPSCAARSLNWVRAVDRGSATAFGLLAPERGESPSAGLPGAAALPAGEGLERGDRAACESPWVDCDPFGWSGDDGMLPRRCDKIEVRLEGVGVEAVESSEP